MVNKLDVVVSGAGLAGLTVARRFAESGKRVLIIEKNKEIGGHCYDYLNENGIIVQKYGPHIFHTDSEEVWNYLSCFTGWHLYHHQVKGLIDGNLVPIPFNLNSLKSLMPSLLSERLENKLLKYYNLGERVPILELRNSDDDDLKFLAQFIYEKIFLNYTAKQWGGKKPEELDFSVSARVPVIVSYDNGYFQNRFQGIPLNGYTNMMKNMVNHPNIHLLTNTHSDDVIDINEEQIFVFGNEFKGPYIYTGPIDELFSNCFGKLPYRSVDIKFESFQYDGLYQETGVINYPNNWDFTRITEFNHFQRDSIKKSTTLCKEYPQEYKQGKNQPFYIVNNSESKAMYQKYNELANKIPNLYCIGRLGEYKYYDMDKVVLSGLALVDKITN